MTPFQKVLVRTFGYEGGYSNDPDDPGGETKFGITKRSYPSLDIKNLTLEEASEILERDFWKRLQLDRIENINIAAEVFDTAMNGGQQSAIRILQRAANAMQQFEEKLIKVDGFIGPKTLNATNAAIRRNWKAFYVTLNCLQAERYVSLTEIPDSTYRKFFHGWINNRVQLLPKDLLE